MSAFVVKDATIDRIVTFLGEDRNADMARIFETLGYSLADNPSLLALALFDMNCEAVDQRYSDHPARTEFHPGPYHYIPNPNYTDAGILKAAGCLRYQCSEGDVPETPLFKVLDDFIGCLARQIAYQTPEYKEAEWE